MSLHLPDHHLGVSVRESAAAVPSLDVSRRPIPACHGEGWLAHSCSSCAGPAVFRQALERAGLLAAISLAGCVVGSLLRLISVEGGWIFAVHA